MHLENLGGKGGREGGGKGREGGRGEGRGKEGGRERSYKEVPGCLDNYEITSLLYSHDPHRIRSLKIDHMTVMHTLVGAVWTF